MTTGELKKIKELLIKGLTKREIAILLALTPQQVDRGTNLVVASMTKKKVIPELDEPKYSVDEMDIETSCPMFSYDDLSYTEKLIYKDRQNLQNQGKL